MLLLTPILAVQLIVLEDFLSEYGIIVFSNLCNLPSFLREDEEKCVAEVQLRNKRTRNTNMVGESVDDHYPLLSIGLSILLRRRARGLDHGLLTNNVRMIGFHA